MTIVLGDLHHGRKHNCTYGNPKIWDYASIKILDNLIAQHEPDRLILAGDVFDNSKPTALAYSELIAIISRIKEVWIIAGNHDISKIEEPIAFNNLGVLPNVNIVQQNQLDKINGYSFVGWQSTQERFDEQLRLVIADAAENTKIITHCSRIDFGNEMDNICTDEHIKLAKEKHIKIISGHEHTSSVGTNFVHLGSVVPHTIAEVGDRYYLFDAELLKIPTAENIVLTREEPLHIDPDKCYYIKTGKEITVEDLKLEEKNLEIDILEAFWKEAKKNGFSKELIDD